jgi:hypothetical protein
VCVDDQKAAGFPVTAACDESDGNCGVPRMYKAPRRAGLVVNRKKLHRLMRKHGMAGRFRRRKCITTVPAPTAT